MRRSLAIALASWLLASHAALAHAFLERADPGAGARLAKAPAVLRLSFSEPLEPSFSGASVTDSAGRNYAEETNVEGGRIAVVLLPLRPGRYVVRWHAVSVDTHRTEGSYSFDVEP